MSGHRFVILKICTLAVVLLLAACATTPPPAPKPAPPPPPRPTSPPVKPTLREYLKQELGPDFHIREEWAGLGGEFLPQPGGLRVWAPIGDVQYVTFHHAEMRPRADTAEMIRSIFHDHTNPDGRLDAADVGYHFFIDVQGQVWEGRDANHIGTHVGSRPPGQNNPGNLGICGLGSFLWQDPPQVMVDRAVILATLIAKYYGHPLTVRGHRDWSGINGEPDGCTTCPGRFECAVGPASEKMLAAFPNHGNGAVGGGTALVVTRRRAPRRRAPRPKASRPGAARRRCSPRMAMAGLASARRWRRSKPCKRFAYIEAAIHIVPPWGGTFLLNRSRL